MKLIVGLGNPGEKYLNTRHNLGFMVVDHLAQKQLGADFKWELDKKFDSEIVKLEDLWLVKPQTMMNASGVAVKKLLDFYKLSSDDLIIIHDDLDLMLGKIKIKLGGSSGGHRGIESIMKEVGTDQFLRVKLGIGNERSHGGEHKRVSFDADRFVVDEFLGQERSKVKHLIKQALEAVEVILTQGLDVAQNRFH